MKAIDRNKPEWLVRAVPVCPARTLLDLQSSADETHYLASPEPFWSVGACYEDFTQTTDEVRAILRATQGGAVHAATPPH